ncbi:MAG: aldehyde dehydrogenase [Acidobacteria bacterium]|nr:aldehyde dehydrogenase [Acidobacteriota bacterium]
MATKLEIPYPTPVEAFLSESPLGVFIAGVWRPTKRKKTFETVDPGSGAILARVYNGEAEDVQDAVEAAQQSFERSGWARMASKERAVYLHRLADLVEKHSETLAEIESLDVGKPLAQARSDIASFPATMRYYSDLALRIQYREPIAVSRHEARTVRHPWGVCGFILPWNFPFLLAGWNISPALAAGNTVVLKPAEDTPLSTLYLTRLVSEAGIPDGVVNVVTGYGEPTGAALANHPGLAHLGFTGSPEVGRLIAQACGRNLVPVKLELGGKGAAVVFDDVDVDRTAEALVRAVTLNAGQVCCTATRWLIQERIYDRFVSLAIDRLKNVKIGYGSDPRTEMGPIINRKQVDRILGYVRKGRREGADVLLKGGEAAVPGKRRGFYVKPAVLAGPPDNVAAREEIFGPVAYLLKFRTEEEAIGLVNRSAYGLANSVWTEDLERANRVAEAMVGGNSWVNAHNVFAHGVPYAGIKLSGMGGGVLGPNTLFDYLRDQSVVRPLR